MESVRSTFQTQLAAVMDSLLAAAVCEIVKIFESSMREQQAEISSLLAKLEQVERRQKTEANGGSAAGEAGDTLRPTPLMEEGKEPDGTDDASTSEPKEVTDSLTSIKQEPPLEPFMVQVPEERVVITDQRTTDPLTDTHTQVKSSHWSQGRPTEEHTPQLESSSETGCCSPANDTSLAQPRQCLPAFDDTRGRMSSPKGLQATRTSCFITAGTSTSPDISCLQSEINAKEENDPFIIIKQNTEKDNSNQKTKHSQREGQSEVQQHQLEGFSPRRYSDDRSSPFSPIREALFSNPICLQSNSESLKPRQGHPLSISGAPSGGSCRPYTCPYCAKSFTYPSHQRRHLLRHTGVRLHPCQFCDKSFLTPSELTVHTRTHTGERPFACAQCGKRFARSGNLRAHQQDVHMRKRPFTCAECGKRFAHRGNLRVHHHRVHQGDPYYMEHQQEAGINPTPT